MSSVALKRVLRFVSLFGMFLWAVRGKGKKSIIVTIRSFGWRASQEEEEGWEKKEDQTSKRRPIGGCTWKGIRLNDLASID